MKKQNDKPAYPRGYFAKLAKHSEVSADVLRHRICLLGWSEEKALSEPARRRRDNINQASAPSVPPPPPPSEYAELTPKLTPLARYFCALALQE